MDKKIHRITYSASALNELTKDQLSAFLLLGLFSNEVNWLQKILLVATLDEGGNEAEQMARLSLTSMLSKLLASKIHEGWNRIRRAPLKDALPTNAKTKSLHDQLAHRLAKDSLIHKVRNNHGFHYPTELSLNGLPNISPGDVALFVTPYSGDNISLISELSAAAGLMAIEGATTVGQALDSALKEIISVAGIYCEYLLETLALFVPMIGVTTCDAIDNDTAPSFEQIRLRFFAFRPPKFPIGDPVNSGA
jgi:hypothetical protein